MPEYKIMVFFSIDSAAFLDLVNYSSKWTLGKFTYH